MRPGLPQQEFNAPRAFTLIELLVSVSIIAMLIAILLPSVARARSQAKAVVCMATCRELGAACAYYVQDHKGYLIPYKLKAGDFWVQAFKKYINVDAVRFCPEAPLRSIQPVPGVLYAFGGPHNAWKADYWGQYAEGSYGYNGHLYDQRAAVFKQTAKTPVFLDAGWVDGWPSPYESWPKSFDTIVPVIGVNGLPRFTINRHGKAVNVGFLDGHVNRVRVANLKRALTWYNGWVPRSPILPPRS